MALDRSQIIVDLVDVVDVFQEVLNGPVHVEVLELAASQRAGRGDCHEDQASRHTRPSQRAQALSAAPFAPLVRPIVVPRPIQALSPARDAPQCERSLCLEQSATVLPPQPVAVPFP